MKATGRRPERQERVEVNLKDGKLSMREMILHRAINLGWGVVAAAMAFSFAQILEAIAPNGLVR